MTWTEPRDLKDNTIITADYWNSLLGENSSLVYLQRKTNARTDCTVISASFSKLIPNQISSATSSTVINTLRFNRLYPQYPNAKYYNRFNGRIALPGGTPYMMFWRISVPTATPSNIEFRSTLNLTRRTAERVVNLDVAAYYFNRSQSVQNSAVFAHSGVSVWNGDRYFITCNHNHGSGIVVSGTITIILNPCFV